MDKKKFLATMLAALLTAFVLIWLQRGPKENTPPATPPPSKPVAQMTLPESAPSPLIQPGSCAPTECHFAPVISPALEMTSNGKKLIGVWNIARSSESVVTIKNVSPDPITVSAVTLSLCLNDAIVPLSSVPPECQFLKISQSDYKSGTMDLKPGDALNTTLAADTHGQVAKLQFDTTRGPIIVLVTVQ